MASRIEGLPDDVSLSDSRIMFLVGQQTGGGLQLFPADLQDIIRQGLDNIAKSFAPGNKVRDINTYSVTGALTTVNFGIDPGANYSQADYYNSGTIPVSIRINTINNFVTGDIFLSPGRTFKIGKHKGFVAFVPESAPSLLEVIEYE